MSKRVKATIQLVHLTGPLKGKVQEFSSFPVTVGRNPNCHVQFNEEFSAISRSHAHLDCREDRFRIVDTSTNGTYVNGKRISEVYLRDGDEIMFSPQGPTAGFLIPIAPPLRKSVPSSGTGSDVADADLTIGPDMEMPVVETESPFLVQFDGVMQVFDRLPITLGKAPSCDVRIDTTGVHDQHLLIFFSEGEYYVKDLTQRMLVSINGRPIGMQTFLAKGAIVTLTEKGPDFRYISGGKLVQIARSK